ncbi:MAG: sodium:proton antiporter [Xanthobacteraceae bacterium]
MFSIFEIIAILLTLTAVFAWINHVVLRLPNTIGLLLMALAASLVLVGAELLLPDISFSNELSRLVEEVHFSEALLQGMLGFLLFAGALQVDLSQLRDRGWVIGVMATVGVFISTIVVASLFWLAAQWLNFPVPFAWALVFGALISPTDPVAVLSTLKEANVKQSVATDIAGESLFNDGVGVVLFTILLAAATHGGDDAFGPAEFLRLFFLEAGGGTVLGLITGYIAYRAMRRIDEYVIEVLISISLVTGTYALASQLHISGPIAVVVAGVFIGNRGVRLAMSETTQRHLLSFWTLIDEILNSVLFLLIGLEVLVLQFAPDFVPLALVAIPIVLMARFFAVALPVLALSIRKRFERGAIVILTWAGVRGGISIALALSIGDVAHRPVILAATYTVAVFTIVVQGLSLGWATKRLGLDGDPAKP